eukprot:gene5828-8037_t
MNYSKKVKGEGGFDHEKINILEDVNAGGGYDDDDDDNERPNKSTIFEFSNSFNVMRLIKLILFVQILGLLVDHPSFKLPILFKIIASGPINYSIKFYSRPFLDIVYIVQYFFDSIVTFFKQQHVPATPNSENIRVVSRMLFIANETSSSNSAFTIDFIDAHNWHSIKLFAHYTLGILFGILSVTFTLSYWEISDYSNRNEIRTWLTRYVADGWWRKGGLDIAIIMTKACFFMLLAILFVISLATQFSPKLFLDRRVFSSIFTTGVCVILVMWFLGYMGIRVTEAVFERYVSQNVSYTSSMILKRAVKAKVELGILFMVAMFMPLLYNQLKAIILISDWNDTLAPQFRQSVNYFVPCYYMAFPPYREIRSRDSCSVGYTIENIQDSYQYSYLDTPTLQCDSYMGITIFVISFTLFVLVFLGFFHIISTMIFQIVTEFKGSKWVDILEKLIRIRDEEYREYCERFSFSVRYYHAFHMEIRSQWRQFRSASIWMFTLFYTILKDLLQVIIGPLYLLFYPIIFLGEKLILVIYIRLTYDKSKKGLVDNKIRKSQSYNSQSKQNSSSNLLVNDSTSQSFGAIQPYESESFSIVSLGGSHATWRTELTLNAKFNLLRRLQNHIYAELFLTKENFITDHELIISYFDCTIDSSECFIYVLFGAVLNHSTTWILKCVAFILVDCVFMFITYIYDPYTDDIDKWLEFMGRYLLLVIAIGSIINERITPNSESDTSQINDNNKSEFISIYVNRSRSQNSSPIGIYIIIDILMVLYFYFYLFYILYFIGFFGVIQRKVKAIQYKYHDHVLDFLVELIDKRTIGFENLYTGLRIIQQWDDIIKLQRRYALLTYPDVRPQTLLSFSEKLFEIKWAAMFNLTIQNIRSSLGLTLLHTVMFSGDTEVARYIIHKNPSLLNEEDSQHDTPISIALKECAYYLLVYSEQNDGNLDDGTYFHDEAYNEYYPEVEDLREEIYNSGEFNRSYSTIRNLNEKECQLIQNEFKFGVIEDDHTKLQSIKPKVIERSHVANSSTDTPQKIKFTANAKQELEFQQKEEKERRNRIAVKQKLELLRKEKASIYKRRFPEDTILDDFECGLLLPWKILGLDVPEVNIFSDKIYNKKQSESYENKLASIAAGLMNNNNKLQVVTATPSTDMNEDTLKGSPSHRRAGISAPSTKGKDRNTGKIIEIITKTGEEDNITQSSKNGKFINQHNKYYNYNDLNDTNDKDLNYIVVTTKHCINVPQPIIIPHDSHKLHDFHDFDHKRKRKKTNSDIQQSSTNHNRNNAPPVNLTKKRRSRLGSFVSEMSENSNGGVSILSTDSITKFGTGINDDEKLAREVRWKICKFAELLISHELTKNCINLKWKHISFQAFNKLASSIQGKLAQALAFSAKLNPPSGYTQICDWTVESNEVGFGVKEEENMNMLLKGVISMVTVGENIAKVTKNVTNNMSNIIFNPSTAITMLARGRNRRRRSFGSSSGGSIGRRKSSASGINLSAANDPKTANDNSPTTGISFNDRIIQFLAELLCSSNTGLLNLSDSELSYNAREGWRAICRVLRQKYCRFILPSSFTPPRPILLLKLILIKNELDCGDCVYITDIFRFQPLLSYVDLSQNRIGSRGMSRMCFLLKSHENIKYFYVNHNNIGPSCGKEIGLLLKKSESLLSLEISHNRLGEIIRFPTMLSREVIKSAAHDIFIGLKSNPLSNLQIFDISYNHLGPSCSDIIPFALCKLKNLHTLNLSGNDIGPINGPTLIFGLAGQPNGVLYAKEKEAFVKMIKERQLQKNIHNNNYEEELSVNELINALHSVSIDSHHDDNQSQNDDNMSIGSGFNQNNNSHSFDFLDSPNSGLIQGGELDNDHTSKINNTKNHQLINKSKKYVKKVLENNKKLSHNATSSLQSLSTAQEKVLLHEIKICSSLTSLSIADNQLGTLCGYAIATLIDRNKNITHLDLSGNALLPVGGMAICDQIELLHNIKPRDFFKIVLWEIEEKKYTLRNAKKRKKVYTHLCSLNMSRNGLGPDVISSLTFVLGHPNCTITDLDVSDNPLGYSVHKAGDASLSNNDIRFGLMYNKSLTNLNLNRSLLQPTELVSMFGGMQSNRHLINLTIQDVYLDEPSCLQLATALQNCPTLTHLDCNNCRMGANGASLVTIKIEQLTNQLKYIDLTNNKMGPIAALYLGEAIRNPSCSIITLLIGSNDLMEEGGNFIARALINNLSITDVDLSNNFLTSTAAISLADAAKGLFVNGKKVTDSKIKRFKINDNPDIGYKGSKFLVKALANDTVEYLSIANIGAKPGTANIIAGALRNPAISWKYLDVSDNYFSRLGLNQIFWALRLNKKCRIINVSLNRTGSKFASNQDEVLSHGISICKTLRNNFVLKYIDLSYNGISSDGGINIFDALIDNHTVKKLSLRGNLLDDSLAVLLSDFLKYNNVCEELDLGYNNLGFSCCYAIAESLELNRSLKVLSIDYNKFGGAGTATLDLFSRSLMMNYSLQILYFDGNKLGPEWGKKLAETFVRNNTLYQVSLRDNRFDPRAGEALLKSFTSSVHLVELGISSDEIGEDLYDLFRVQYALKRASIDPHALKQDTILTIKQREALKGYD